MNTSNFRNVSDSAWMTRIMIETAAPKTNAKDGPALPSMVGFTSLRSMLLSAPIANDNSSGKWISKTLLSVG